MPSENRRIALTVTPDLANSMRMLGLVPESDGRDGVPTGAATQVASALASYAAAVEHAGREAARDLDRTEWNCIADIMNGSAEIWCWDDRPMPILPLIVANIQDGHALDGLGYKWFSAAEPALTSEANRKACDRRIKLLVDKLNRMSPIHGDAIAAALRHFWRSAGDIDYSEAKWWTPDFRTKPKKEMISK